MASTNNAAIAQSIRSELDSARAEFHSLLDSLSENDCRRRSLNPGWTNGEVLAHMVFGFVIAGTLLPLARFWGRLPKSCSRPLAWVLNALTGPFNRVNALGARMQGRVFTRNRIGALYDRASGSLLKRVASIKGAEWGRGMHYPVRWDPNFGDFMTLERLFRYPVVHFEYHLKQIAR